MNRDRLTFFPIGFVALGAILLFASVKLPLWRLRMESPQYRNEEAIKVAVYPDALRGDLKEIDTLNQYIGVHVPHDLPQCHWLPGALMAAGALGLCAVFLPRAVRKWALIAVPATLSVLLLFAAIQAKQQMYDIGHHRNEKTPLRGVKDFTPPFLGKAKLFQFEVESRLDAGAYLIAGAIAFQFGAARLMGRKRFSCCVGQSTTSATPKTKEALA